MQVLSAINLTQQELQNAKIQNLASDPGTPVAGQIYYNTVSNALRFYNGTVWITLGRLDQTSAPTASVSMNSQLITNLATPVSNADAATKAYVDSVAQGIDAKPSARAATTANITLSAPQTIDGVSVIAGDRVLVKDQGTASQNGIYVVAAGAWTRAEDMDAWTEVPGAFVFVEEGTTLADSGWICSSNAGGTLGTTAITWVQFSQAGVVLADEVNLTKSGVTISMANMAATSVKGRSAGTTGAPADIAASADNQVLRRSGGTLAFGTIDTAAIGSGTLAAARMPALTGDVTMTAGTTTTAIAAGVIVDADVNASAAIAWTKISKTGSSLADLATRSAADLSSGTLLAARMPALTGDVTTTAGAVATTIANNAVTNAKAADMAVNTIKGRITAGTGDPEDLTAAQVRTILGLAGQYAADVGNGSLTDITVNHALGTRDVTVEVYRNSSPWDTVQCDVERTDTNNVTLRFAVAPTAAQYRVVVK